MLFGGSSRKHERMEKLSAPLLRPNRIEKKTYAATRKNLGLSRQTISVNATLKPCAAFSDSSLSDTFCQTSAGTAFRFL